MSDYQSVNTCTITSPLMYELVGNSTLYINWSMNCPNGYGGLSESSAITLVAEKSQNTITMVGVGGYNFGSWATANISVLTRK